MSMIKLKNRNLNWIGLLVFIGPVFFTSCLEDNTEALEQEAKMKYEKLLSSYKMTSADSIGYGVYMKYIDTSNVTEHIKPVASDYAMISYTGYNSAGELIETSDSKLAKDKKSFHDDLVYGPAKVRVGSTLAGIYLALINMYPRSTVQVVMPADMAYGNYEPVVYTISLHTIIKNLVTYEDEQRNAYKAAIGFNGTLNSDSTIEYNITQTGNNEDPELDYYSKVKISLRAYYAEWVETDSLLMHNPGRQFFPINGASDTISYIYQYSVGFPLTAAMDSMLVAMKKGETREFITTSNNTYGEIGFVHPYFNVYIVPPYTSVHYIMKLIDVVNQN